jgi:hypothetical protein
MRRSSPRLRGEGHGHSRKPEFGAVRWRFHKLRFAEAPLIPTFSPHAGIRSPHCAWDTCETTDGVTTLPPRRPVHSALTACM